ncbi:PaaX family transcriptional regulator C-terminal domain-containing protein [Polycyclovorans algicola]|uniref:PaaX family transcriptional regulator C-terminal domain-containing protein n=1 Tax=Polycyclovorans algicola TaxID=616992 RepID=UPI0009FBEB72|nr:PaaX family transcriptional regulator C-terminal domain-containing protein [Polycyclovorans algicola]
MLNPRRLVLKLLLAADRGVLSTREAVAAGQLMGFTENSVRVALARLSSQHLIEAFGRGAYHLGPAGQSLAADVKRWRSGEARVVPWSGHWVAVHTAALSRSDRSVLRQRERAFGLLGLRELQPGLHVRPDNLRGGVAAVRSRLHALGMPAEALVFGMHELDDGLRQRAQSLWDGAACSAHYRQQRAQLEQWMAHAATLAPDVAAREAFVIGDAAIRTLVFDPLLPEPLVDVAARAAFTDAVLQYDRLGHACWQHLLGSQTAASSGRRSSRTRPVFAAESLRSAP